MDASLLWEHGSERLFRPVLGTTRMALWLGTAERLHFFRIWAGDCPSANGVDRLHSWRHRVLQAAIYGRIIAAGQVTAPLPSLQDYLLTQPKLTGQLPLSSLNFAFKVAGCIQELEDLENPRQDATHAHRPCRHPSRGLGGRSRLREAPRVDGQQRTSLTPRHPTAS